jgi:soluble lytic murein transglycosylase-like protein
MRKYPSSYVHRGDAARLRARIKRVAVVLGFGATALMISKYRDLPSANAESTHEVDLFSGTSELRAKLDSTRGELDLAKAELERARRVMHYSTRYRIAADLAGDILDVSQAEGIDAELAFRLVKLESDFNERATSPVGALGLTQLMPATAKYFIKGEVTRERLYDRHTNLRAGFRYLRTLVGEYKGDVKLALLVYNRGPVAVHKAMREGTNPTNGYDRIITKGYTGKGTVD